MDGSMGGVGVGADARVGVGATVDCVPELQVEPRRAARRIAGRTTVPFKCIKHLRIDHYTPGGQKGGLDLSLTRKAQGRATAT
jgi:hypothetical protein